MDAPSAVISALFAELGPQIEAIERIVSEPDSASWMIDFDDDSNVLAESADEPERLVLQALLGAPHAKNKARVHELVLAFNSLWHDTGGARIGLFGDDGELVLMADVIAAGLDLPQPARQAPSHEGIRGRMAKVRDRAQ